MKRTLMTTKAVLDLAATPSAADEHDFVEAVLMLNAGARATHQLVFDRETPVKRRRWFDHCFEICDAWETVSEKRLMEDYGNVTWWVGDE